MSLQKCRPLGVRVALGAWSYAIYLIHPIVIDALSKILPEGRLQHLLLLPLTLGILLPLAWLLHVHVEKPFIELGRRAAARIPKPINVGVAVDLPASGT